MSRTSKKEWCASRSHTCVSVLAGLAVSAGVADVPAHGALPSGCWADDAETVLISVVLHVAVQARALAKPAA